jgi:hypothetical protein
MTPPDSPSLLSTLTVAAVVPAAGQAPALMAAAGFGEGQDPRPMLAWYAIGGLAFLAMLARNLIGFFADLGKVRGAKKRRQMEEGEAEGEPLGFVDWHKHNEEISAAHQKVDRLETDLISRIDAVRRELTEKVDRVNNTVTAVGADAAAAKAGAAATNTLLKQVLTRMTKGGTLS